MKKAVILGASGLVGSFLLDELITSPEIEKVYALGRRPLNNESPKLEQITGDLMSADFWELSLDADLLFICIGTTKAKTPDESWYFKIDHGIPVSAAKWAKAKGLKRLLVVSALGAKSQSSNFYLSTKGKMEEDVHKFGPETVVLRPSMIMGPRQETRPLEAIAMFIFRILNPLIPKKYRGVQAKDIARALYNLSLAETAPELVLSKDIPKKAKA